MKRKFAILFALLCLMISCLNTDCPEGIQYGTITLKALLSGTDFSLDGYTAALAGAEERAIADIPESGKIEGLPAGTYSITITDKADHSRPAFNMPDYKGEMAGIVVESGKNTEANIEMFQANSSMKFVFDPSLDDAGYAAIAPLVKYTNSLGSLVYDADNRLSYGYFEPGKIEIILKLGNDIIPVGNEQSVKLALAEKEAWTVTVKAGEIAGTTVETTGGSDVIEKIMEIVLAAPVDPAPEYNLAISGMEGEEITVTYVDGSTYRVVLSSDGQGELPVNGLTIKTISGSGDEILIGRTAGAEMLYFATEGGNLVFGPPDTEGRIPVNIMGELMLINSGDKALSGSYIQLADIGLMDEPWSAIGGDSAAFGGTYDGGGKSLSGLNGASNAEINGLFGVNKGTLKNITVLSGNMAGGETGAICGRNEGAIDFCRNEGCVVSFKRMNASAGGIVGNNTIGAVVSNCYNNGTVEGSSSLAYAGGICGYNVDGYLKACRNDGTVAPTATSSSIVMAGGICGLNEWESWDSDNAYILACYNTGGFGDSADVCFGGIAGWSIYGFIAACYNVGVLPAGHSYSAALVYQSDNPDFNYCYWSGAPDNAIKHGETYRDLFFYFDDGTAAPNTVSADWPSESVAEEWKIYDGAEGYWKDLGVKGTTQYPKLWWE